MKLYLKSGQVVKINEVCYAVCGNNDDYVDYDEYEIPRLQADKLMEDVVNKNNDYIIEFYGKDNCLCFTTSLKQISGIAE